MLLHDLAAVSDRVAATTARNEKLGILAAAITDLDESELVVGVSYLAGLVPQGSFGIGYASLRDLPLPAITPTLSLADVDTAFSTMASLSGSGSSNARRRQIERLFAAATATGQRFMQALLTGGLRQGASERLMMDAVAKATGVRAALVRRAVMFTGDLGEVVVAAASGTEAVAAFGLRLFRPVLPMLAKTAPTVEEAMSSVETAVVERKLDGARIQAHLSGGEVRVYTRNLNEVTGRLPEVVELVSGLPVDAVVLDGEVIALRDDGRPQPFQVTMARFGAEGVESDIVLSPFFFDVLHLEGRDVLDLPLSERILLLDDVIPEPARVLRLTSSEPAAAQEFFAETLAAGHEGVMIKSPDAPYQAGRRGAGWLKVKPVHTLDLVVLAVEWGSGRRHGWLSNIHLGARAPDGQFVMLGKTFKGMTDKLLEWQTKRFLELETHRKGRIVYVRPEQVVEIAFDGIQSSSRYPGGMALRFARVKGYRDDKAAEESDSIETVREVFEATSS